MLRSLKFTILHFLTGRRCLLNPPTSKKSQLTLLIIQHKLFRFKVDWTGGTNLRPISGWLRDSLRAQSKTGRGWVAGISHIRRSTAINLPGYREAQLWPFFTPDWRRFAKPFLEAGIKRISVAVLQFFACHMLHQGKR